MTTAFVVAAIVAINLGGILFLLRNKSIAAYFHPQIEEWRPLDPVVLKSLASEKSSELESQLQVRVNAQFERILPQLNRRCFEAAAKGKFKAAVFKFDKYEYVRKEEDLRYGRSYNERFRRQMEGGLVGGGIHNCSPDDLCGLAAKIWNFCAANNLNPKFGYSDEHEPVIFACWTSKSMVA